MPSNPARPITSTIWRWLEFVSPRRAILIGMLLLSAIGALDYLVGAEITFTTFYLLPVSIVAWYAGRRWGMVIAAMAVLVWLFANVLAGLRYSQPAAYVWNTLMGLGPLVLVAYLFSWLRQVIQREQQLARTDYVTGALNARAFDEALQIEIARATRYSRPLTVAYLDLDRFKSVNDQLGHGTGDEVLRAVVNAARRSLRATDIVARVGGDEFGLLLPETGPAQARVALEKVRRLLLENMGAQRWPVTFSIGVLICRGPAVGAADVLRAADSLMYEVKRAGKNGMQFGEFPAQPPPAALSASDEPMATGAAQRTDLK